MIIKIVLTLTAMDLFLVDTNTEVHNHPFGAHVWVVEVHVLFVGSFVAVYDHPNVVEVSVPMVLVKADLNLLD